MMMRLADDEIKFKYDLKLRECGPLSGTAGSEMGRVVTLWEGMKSIPWGTTYIRLTVGCIEPPVQRLHILLCREGQGSFITYHPSGTTFTTCMVRGVLLPRSSTGTLFRRSNFIS